MTYNFKTDYARELHAQLPAGIPICFTRDDHMAECASMDFCEGTQSVQIRYKSTADEIVDIAHELIHVRMQFLHGFPLLAWPSNCSGLTADIEDAVKRIRDAVDDTYVLQQLFADTAQLPVSAVFYREVRGDLKQGIMRLVQSVPALSRPFVAAWRLRLADLSCCAFKSSLTTNQSQLAADFLSRFKDKEPAVRDLFMHLKQDVGFAQLSDPQQFGRVLLGLRDKLGLPSWLHLATRQRVNGKWVLKQ